MNDFGPQLIGETEKTLNALLGRVLEGTGLTEPQWVTLRIASQLDGGQALTAAVADRAHFADASDLIDALRRRGLLEGDALSADGRALLSRLIERTATLTAPIWADLPTDDVAAAARVLNAVVERARRVLAA